MPLPAGWTANGLQEYQATLKDRDGNDYVVNVNVQTGQKQIYTVQPFGRTYLVTVSANGDLTWDGSTTANQAWKSIANTPGGPLRLSVLRTGARTAGTKILGSVGTEEQKKRLSELGEFRKLKNQLPPPAPNSPGGTNPDQGGPNSGGGTNGGATTKSAPFRNVSNFGKEETYGNAIYPKEMNLSQDHMTISAYRYQVADVFAGSNGESDINSNLILGGAASLSSRSNQTKTFLGQVTLPMPANISEANSTGWGEDSLSNLAAGLMGGAVNAVGSIANAELMDGIRDISGTAGKLFKGPGSTQIRQQLTLNAGASIVKKLGVNVNAESYRARVTGTVINPNLELLFNGPKLRAFQFSYKLSARSSAEAVEIRKIIKFFKKAMAPKRAQNGLEDGFFLGAPDVFQIVFKNGKKESISLPTIKTCALVNFTTNYTADGFYAAYQQDGQPVSVQIDLSFAELTPVYNDNYGSDDSVGFVGGSEGLDKLENPLYDPNDILAQQEKADTDKDNAPPPVNRGGASDVTAPATRVLQPGGPTATPGIDTPIQQPPFAGGVPPA